MSTLPIAIVGLNFGRRIINDIVNKGAGEHVHLAAVCDVDEAKARQLSGECGVPYYTSLDELLQKDSGSTIGLFTGPMGRAALLEQISTAGRDVMTTKPFEMDPVAAAAVLEKAGGLGRVIHLNSPNPGLIADLAVIESWRETFDLGTPVAARADVWASYRERPDGRWYDNPAKCPVAPVFRLGIYVINDLVRLFGRARRVSVMSTRLFTERPTADNAQLAIEFESGALANVFSSFCVRDGDYYRNSLTLNCEGGTVYRNVGPERQGGAAELSVVVADEATHLRRVADRANVQICSGHYDWAGFVSAVRGEAGAPAYQIDHIIEPLRIIKAMAEAERSGTMVRVEHE